MLGEVAIEIRRNRPNGFVREYVDSGSSRGRGARPEKSQPGEQELSAIHPEHRNACDCPHRGFNLRLWIVKAGRWIRHAYPTEKNENAVLLVRGRRCVRDTALCGAGQFVTCAPDWPGTNSSERGKACELF